MAVGVVGAAEAAGAVIRVTGCAAIGVVGGVAIEITSGAAVGIVISTAYWGINATGG